MKNNADILSAPELNILQLLRTENRPLSRPEILEKAFSQNDPQKHSVHRFLNHLLNKNLLTVAGSVQCGKTYGRTYSPTLTRDEYITAQTAKFTPELAPQKRVFSVISALIENEYVDDSTISQLEDLLQQKRKELRNK